jgi:outer membrane protein OmpA-like peptidoglycan-associated protein
MSDRNQCGACFVIGRRSAMRTSFIVGIFGLALAVAGATEWASRRAIAVEPRPPSSAPGLLEKAALPEPAGSTSGAGVAPEDKRPFSPDAAVGLERVFVIDGRDGGFRVNAVSLSEGVIDAIDAQFVDVNPAELASARFVIEGHTDALGAKDVNTRIALARALAIREYLKDRFDVPIEMMRVVSYGGERPAADNATPDGRAQNRRVVIRMTVVDGPHD